jgi:hypothetical protein
VPYCTPLSAPISPFPEEHNTFHVKIPVKTVLSPRLALLGENSAFVVLRGQEFLVPNALLGNL